MPSENDPKKLGRTLGFAIMIAVILVGVFCFLMATEPSAPQFLRGAGFVVFIIAAFAAIKIYKRFDLKSRDSFETRGRKSLHRLAVAYAVATVIAVGYVIAKPSWLAASQVLIGSLLTYWFWSVWKKRQGPEK